MKEKTENKYHIILASYFSGNKLYSDDPVNMKPNIRKLVELPWQQTKGEMWDEVTETLCNLDFIQAKAAAKLTYELVNDYINALEVIPDNQNNIREERARLVRMDKYTKDLIAYAKGEIKDLEIPESITPWSEARIEEEIERIRNNPNNADKLKDFSHFIGSKTAIFQKYASEFPHHVYDQAWHYANDGPVGRAAENIAHEIIKTLLLCDQNSRPAWNPLPHEVKIIQSSQINSIAITPDGNQAIVGGVDCCLHWNLATGEIIKKMEGDRSKSKVQFYGGTWGYPLIEEHKGSNVALSITPDGKIAFTGQGRSIYGVNKRNCLLWDISGGKIIQTLIGHSVAINTVSITPDGSRAISGSDDKTCIVWDLKSGGKPKILEGHISRVISVSISADGKWAVSASDNYQDKPIIWDVEKGEKLRILDYPESEFDEVRHVYLTPDGKRTLRFGRENLTFFDTKSGETLQITKGIELSYGLKSLSITPDGKRGLSPSSDNNCVLWDLTTGEKLLTLSEHKSTVEAVSITPDGRYGLSSSFDKTIILWDLEKGKTLGRNNHREISHSQISITPDGKQAFANGNSNGNASCVLMDLETLRIKHEILATPDHINPPHNYIYSYGVSSVAITPNGQRGISGLYDFINYNSLNSQDKELNTIKVYDLLKGDFLQNLIGHTGPIKDFSITEDGRGVISSSEDESCILWDLVTGERLRTFKGHGFKVPELVRGQGRTVDKVSIVPDGKLVILSTTGGGCRVWNIQNSVVIPITPPLGKAVAITPDGKWVISIISIPESSTADSLIIWNLKTGKEHKIIKHYSKSLFSVSASPDGKRAITASADGTCFLCDIENGKILSDHISAFGIYSVKYLPQGIFLSHQYEEFGFLHSDKKMLCPGIAFATIKQIWDFELNKFTAPLVYCPLCGHRFEAKYEIINTVIRILKDSGIKSDQSPCLELPDEAWEHPGLIGECPSCHEKIKFNPFFGSDMKEIQDYLVINELELKYQKILDDAEKAFKEKNWEEAYGLFIKLLQQGRFDPNYLCFNIAICRINGLRTIDKAIVSDIEFLIQLLSDNGAREKAEQITGKLKEKLDSLSQDA